MTTMETNRYLVVFTRNGTLMQSVCATIAGYSTIDDVPRMIRTRFGPEGIEIDSITRITEEESS